MPVPCGSDQRISLAGGPCCKLQISCRGRVGGLDSCWHDPYHPPFVVGCFSDNGMCADGWTGDVECVGRGYRTESADCCPDYGSGSATCTYTQGAPIYRTDPLDTYDVRIPCDGTSGECPAPNNIIDTCGAIHFFLSGEVTVASLRSDLLAAMDGYAYPDWSGPMELSSPDIGIYEGYCPVSSTYYGLGFLSATGIVLRQVEYKFTFAPSGASRTLNWEEWLYPNIGDPIVTPMTESIAGGVNESSVHALDPPDEYGTKVVYNAAFA